MPTVVTDKLLRSLVKGPGCSGLGAMLSEIGPFLLPKNNQNKTIVKRNPHSWTNAGWVMFIDQPGHVGLSEVEYLPDANQTVLAKQFAGFLSNFYHAFPDLKSKNLWLQGESYGGQFVPHFADYFYNLTGEDAVPLKGVGVVSGLFQSPTWAVNVPSYEYLKTHKDVLQLNASAVDAIDARAKELGLTGYFNQSLLYPPNGSILPPKNYTDDRERSVPYLALPYLLDTNPCFDFYDIRARCPAGFNPLASKNNFINATPGLRKALHVDEDNTWEACVKYKYIYPGGDPTPFAFEDGSFTRVVEKSQRVVIFGGQDDYKVLSLGTQLGLQVSLNGGSDRHVCLLTRPLSPRRMLPGTADKASRKSPTSSSSWMANPSAFIIPSAISRLLCSMQPVISRQVSRLRAEGKEHRVRTSG